MFGFSLQKLLVLVAIIVAVWYGFKWVGRLQEARDAEAAPRTRTGGFRWPRSMRRRAREGEGRAEVEDTVQCPVCQAYVPARAAAGCGRADCPY